MTIFEKSFKSQNLCAGIGFIIRQKQPMVKVSWFLFTLASWSKNTVSHSWYPTAQSWSCLAVLLPSHNSLSLCFIPTVVTVAHTSQLWHWQPVAFMGAGCPFSSWVQIALFNWQSKLFRPCPGPFIGHDLLRLSWVRVEALFTFCSCPWKLPLRDSVTKVTTCEIIHSVICAPLVRSHFVCPKCRRQLKRPQFVRHARMEINAIKKINSPFYHQLKPVYVSEFEPLCLIWPHW